MEKTRDLFKKIRDTKGTFYAKIGTIKDRNGMDLTEAVDIKKRWQEFTEEQYKKKKKKRTWDNGLVPDWERSIQSRLLSPCLFKLYAEYIMQNAGLDEAQARIKSVRRNINNFRYPDDTTLMAESEEELKSLLVKVKEESERVV